MKIFIYCREEGWCRFLVSLFSRTILLLKELHILWPTHLTGRKTSGRYRWRCEKGFAC